MARFKIKRFFSNPVSSIVSIVKDTISGIGNLVSNIAETIAETVKKEINNAVKFIEDRVKDITQSIENMVQKTLDGIKDVYDKIVEETKRFIESAEGAIKDGIDSIQTSFTKITSSISESILPDFLEQSVKNNLKFASDFIATYLKNAATLGSSVAQLDLKSAEDDLKKIGKDFDDQFHDGLKLIEDNINSGVDLLQYTRDEVVRPVWNITRENLSSIAHTIEKEAIRPTINNLIHEIDLLVEVTMPDQLAKQYERAKSAVEDATHKLREVRKDVNESLEQFEEEVKKAGKLIDDMKMVIIQTAAVIGVGFVPAFGPLLSIALQAVFDEINGNQSIFDKLLEGDFSNIDEIIIAAACAYTGAESYSSAAKAMQDVAKTLKLSQEVAKALNIATQAYEVYNKVNQYKDTVEAILDGDFKEVTVQLLKTAGQEFANQASLELSGYVNDINKYVDISKILENEQLIRSVVNLDFDQIKDHAILVVSDQIATKVSNYIPKDFENLINQNDIKSLISGDFSIFEDKAKSFITNTIQEYVGDYIPKDLKNILDPQAIEQIIKGDFNALKDNLLQELSQNIASYANLNLPDSIANFVSSEEITALISGDTSIIENKLKEIVDSEILSKLSDVINPELIEIIKLQNIDDIKTNIINYAEGQLQLQSIIAKVQLDNINFTTITELKANVESQIDFYQEQIAKTQQQIIDIQLQVQAEIESQVARYSESYLQIKSELQSQLESQLQNLQSQLESNLESMKSQIELQAKIEIQLQSEVIYSNLNQYKDQIVNNQSIQSALIFKNSIEQEISAIEDKIQQAQETLVEYKATIEEYREEFTTRLNSYIEDYKQEFAEIKSSVITKYQETSELFSEYKNGLYNEFNQKITDTKSQIEALIFEANELLVANYVAPIIETKETAQSQIDNAINNIKQNYQNKISQIQELSTKLENDINARIEQIRSFENNIKQEINSIESNIDFLQKNTKNILSKEYFDKLQLLNQNIKSFENLIKNPEYIDELNIIIQTQQQIQQQAQQQIEQEIKNFTNQSQLILQKIYDSRFESINNAIISAITNTTSSTAVTTLTSATTSVATSVASTATSFNQQFIKNIIKEYLDEIKQKTNINNFLSEDDIKNITTQTINKIKSSITITSGDAYDSTINLSNSITKNYIIDNRGNDNITSGQNKDYIESGEGNDIINSNSGDDIIYAGSGNDTIYGGAGSDEIYGGEGDDLVYGDISFEIPFSYRSGLNTWISSNIEGANIDISRIKFGDFNGDGADDIYYVNGWGNNAKDDIWLSNKDGTFSYRSGLNTWISSNIAGANIDISRIKLGDFNGDGADDIYYVNGWGNNAKDDIWLSSRNDDQNEYNKLFGDSGNDNIFGGVGNDTIIGGTGNDNLYGKAGNDILIGGLGSDKLFGEAGNDIFKFENIGDSHNKLNQAEIDLIADFAKGYDKIDLSAINSINNIDQLSIAYNSTNNTTTIDDNNSDFAINLTGNILLSANDFVFKSL